MEIVLSIQIAARQMYSTATSSQCLLLKIHSNLLVGIKNRKTVEKSFVTKKHIDELGF